VEVAEQDVPILRTYIGRPAYDFPPVASRAVCWHTATRPALRDGQLCHLYRKPRKGLSRFSPLKA